MLMKKMGTRNTQLSNQRKQRNTLNTTEFYLPPPLQQSVRKQGGFILWLATESISERYRTLTKQNQGDIVQ